MGGFPDRGIKLASAIMGKERRDELRALVYHLGTARHIAKALCLDSLVSDIRKSLEEAIEIQERDTS